MNDFKLNLLLSCLRITCRFYDADEEPCLLSERHPTDLHITCNCNGNINECDLPEKFYFYLWE